MMQQHSFDIAIVGGGIVGLALACALADCTNKTIAVLEAKPAKKIQKKESPHHRVSALTLASQRILQRLQVWQALESISPFNKIEVWDSAGSSMLDFKAAAINEKYLGFIVENDVLHEALLNKCLAHAQIDYFAPVQLSEVHFHPDHVELVADDAKFSAQLAVAADGAQSWLREAAQIKSERTDYHAHAIVTSVKTTLQHKQTARQIFTSAGPLAFLPLKDEKWSSIVWSQPTSLAKSRMELDSDAFATALGDAFGYRLGEIVQVEKRYSFPLFRQSAKVYIKPRLALVGDAAHHIHPLAGQGVNMGLLDAASLVDVIVEAEKNHGYFASERILRRYERWRKADNLPMYVAVDALHKAFQAQHQLVSQARNLALQTLPACSFLVNWLTCQAVGNRSDLPTLAQNAYP